MWNTAGARRGNFRASYVKACMRGTPWATGAPTPRPPIHYSLVPHDIMVHITPPPDATTPRCSHRRRCRGTFREHHRLSALGARLSIHTRGHLARFLRAQRQMAAAILGHEASLGLSWGLLGRHGPVRPSWLPFFWPWLRIQTLTLADVFLREASSGLPVFGDRCNATINKHTILFMLP